jgi:hypothetical protein
MFFYVQHMKLSPLFHFVQGCSTCCTVQASLLHVLLLHVLNMM